MMKKSREPNKIEKLLIDLFIANYEKRIDESLESFLEKLTLRIGTS